MNDSRDAREAILCGKQNVEGLCLQWGSQFDNSRDEVVEENVLDMLQPHQSIKKLIIRHYGGARFPVWIREPWFSKMGVLKLDSCENCTALPSLGPLMSLKVLTIRGMKKLKTITDPSL